MISHQGKQSTQSRCMVTNSGNVFQHTVLHLHCMTCVSRHDSEICQAKKLSSHSQTSRPAKSKEKVLVYWRVYTAWAELWHVRGREEYPSVLLRMRMEHIVSQCNVESKNEGTFRCNKAQPLENQYSYSNLVGLPTCRKHTKLPIQDRTGGGAGGFYPPPPSPKCEVVW